MKKFLLKRKKGFTLIELLAVIVILAIIALIAVPIMLNIIANSKLQATIDSVYGVEEAVRYNYMEEILDDKLVIDETTYTCDDQGCKNSNNEYVKMSGGKPTGGEITIDKNGTVTNISNLVIGEYVCFKDNADSEVSCRLASKLKIPVTYENNGGRGCSSKEVDFNGTFGSLCVPEKEGYTFDGWYSSEEKGVENTTQVRQILGSAESITLYARWSKGNFDLTLSKGTGVSVVSATGCTLKSGTTYSCIYDTEVTLSATAITGYEKISWSGVTLTDNKFMMPANSVTAEATASAKEYTVALDNQGATSAGTTSITAEYDSPLLKIDIPIKDGYVFNGYYTEAGEQYIKEDGTSARNWDKTDVTKLYARWNPNTVSLKYDSNGGSSCPNIDVTSGETYKSLCEPTREGYNFDGWYLSEENNNGLGIKVTNESIIVATEGLTLYAGWVKGNFDLTLSKGTGVSGVSATGCTLKSGTTYSCIYDTEVTLSADEDTGYEKISWSGVTLTDNKFKMPANSVTAKATASAKKYTVTLDNQSATVAGTTSITATYNSALPTITVPTKTGYKFNGYYTSTIGGDKYINADGTSARNWDKIDVTKLYASWTINKVYVKFHMNGGVWGGSTNTSLSYSGSYVTLNGLQTVATYTYGQTGIDLANYNNSAYINITRNGYGAKSGAEWNLNSAGTGKSFNHGTATTNANDLCNASSGDCTATLYVNWTPTKLYLFNNGKDTGYTWYQGFKYTTHTTSSYTAYFGTVTYNTEGSSTLYTKVDDTSTSWGPYGLWYTAVKGDVLNKYSKAGSKYTTSYSKGSPNVYLILHESKPTTQSAAGTSLKYCLYGSHSYLDLSATYDANKTYYIGFKCYSTGENQGNVSTTTTEVYLYN